jgi:hypothetical protein
MRLLSVESHAALQPLLRGAVPEASALSGASKGARDGPSPRSKTDVPHDDPKSREQGEENRKEMDEIPPHGTDPLHEGP